MRRTLFAVVTAILCAATLCGWLSDSACASEASNLRHDESSRDIDAILDEVSGERLFVTIDSLSSYWTRRTGEPSNLWAADYIMRRIEELGYEEAYFDSFWCEATNAMERNIVFEKEGTALSKSYVVLSAHFDCASGGQNDARAPGADDNASGIAGLLEIARVVKDLPLLHDVVFACFNAEDWGFLGSEHFVENVLAEGDSVLVCLNLDCIAYTDGSWKAAVQSEYPGNSIGQAIEGLIAEHTSLTPSGWAWVGSDHMSFINAGIPGAYISEDPFNLLIDSPADSIALLSQAYATEMARAYLAALLAIAELEGNYLPIAPVTFLEETCSTEALGLPPGARAEFRWRGEDFDGEVAYYEYRLLAPSASDTNYHTVQGSQEFVEFVLSEPGIYEFELRAVDDEGLRDPTPASTTVLVGMTYAYPELRVETDLGGWASFRGAQTTTSSFPDTLFSGETIRFSWRGSADRYCSELTGYMWAWDDTTVYYPPAESIEETLLTVHLEPGDHVLKVKVLDELGYETVGTMRFHAVEFTGTGPLLVVDDFNHFFVDDESENAFFDTLLAGREWSEWDPDDHVSGLGPKPPPLTVLALSEHVLWSVDSSTPQLAEFSVGGYNYLEGYVRAGGNLILVGWCPTQALGGFPDYPCELHPGDFLYDFAGLAEARNTGGSSSPNPPSQYGFAFLGAIAMGASGFEDVYVDTVGKWGPYFPSYGGLPYCDAYDATPDCQEIFSFRSHINPTFDGSTCGVRRFGTSGEGSVAVLGFPLYYLQTSDARNMIGRILDDFAGWTTPAELLSFEWSAAADSVMFSWTVPVDAGVQGFRLWRREQGSGEFEEVTQGMIDVSAEGEGSHTDRSVAEASSYEYRLAVVERWGGTTEHGPWLVVTSEMLPSTLSLSYAGRNPFAAATSIALGVPSPGEEVRVEVFDVAGRSVVVICDTYFEPGVHEIPWDGRDRSAHEVASGVYFVRARGRSEEAIRKLVRLR